MQAFLAGFAVLCALVGAFVTTAGVLGANGAPQQAAAAAVGIAWAVIPYCIVRLIQERARDLRDEMAKAQPPAT